jgi:hypothetical protein
MNETNFYIFGPLAGGDPSYYNIDKGWIYEFEDATPFTGEILTLPLPQGTTCVMALSTDFEPLEQYDPLSHKGSNNFFQQSY